MDHMNDHPAYLIMTISHPLVTFPAPGAGLVGLGSPVIMVLRQGLGAVHRRPLIRAQGQEPGVRGAEGWDQKWMIHLCS